jgi:hypothetical protein
VPWAPAAWWSIVAGCLTVGYTLAILVLWIAAMWISCPDGCWR